MFAAPPLSSQPLSSVIQIFHLRFSHFGLNNETQWDLAVEPAFGLTRHQAVEEFMGFAGTYELHRLGADRVDFD